LKRKILITGGTGLIGSELVKKFAEDDFHVLFTSRSIDNAKRIKKSIPEADYLIVDFTDNESFGFFTRTY
jgi:short-subunit dehydrogenase